MAKKSGKTAAPSPSGGTVSKMEAVRRALAELGNDAMPLEILGFVRRRFGLEMTVNHVSNCKSEIARQRAKAKPAAKPAPAPRATSAATVGGGQPGASAGPDGGPAEARPEPAVGAGATVAPASASTAASPVPVTKIEAVRRALAEMGREATASLIRPWIKQKYDLDVSNDQISKYKGMILAEGRGGAKPAGGQSAAARAAGPKPAATKPAPARASGSAPAARGGQAAEAGGIRFEDVQATRELVDRVGADRLRALIALFDR